MSNNSDETRHMNDSTMPPPKRTGKKAAAPPVRIKKGFGLSDWTRLVKSSKDLAQLKGQGLRKNITKDEVKQHNKIYDGWMIVHNKVYNIAPYLQYHPGGSAILKPYLGKDATAMFEKYHRWVNVDGLIGVLLLGYLDLTPSAADAVSTANNDGFAIPAPRPKAKAALPSLLPKDDDDEDEADVDPLGN